MSRPPNHREHRTIDSAYHNGVIDFTPKTRPNPMMGSQMPNATPQMMGNQMYQPYPSPYMGDELPPSVYAQAGFPGYAQPAGYAQPIAAPYPVYPEHMGPASLHPSLQSSAAPNAEELRERIDQRIDSILNSQKTAALGSQLDKLSERVSRLTQDLVSTQHSARQQSPRRSSPPRRTESSYGDSTFHDGLSSEAEDENIARRLRALAAESSMRAERADKRKGRLGSGMPDW